MEHKLQIGRQTQKARKARQLAAQLIDTPVRNMRADREAIDLMYKLLTELGYQWVSSKQEWALVEAPKQRGTIPFVLHMALEDEQELFYAVTQSFAAAGFDVRTAHRRTETDEMGTTVVYFLEMER